jgi:hypothetical protein
MYVKRIKFNAFDSKRMAPFISFISVLDNGELFTLSLDDYRSLNELKQISKYEVSK